MNMHIPFNRYIIGSYNLPTEKMKTKNSQDLLRNSNNWVCKSEMKVQLKKLDTHHLSTTTTIYRYTAHSFLFSYSMHVREQGML